MAEFYALYVAKKVPTLAGARVVAPILVPSIYKTEAPELPADRFEGKTFAEALATFEGEPSVRVLFEEGASGKTVPSGPLPRWIESYETWPIPSAVSTTWYLGDNGSLNADKQTAGTADSYKADPTALPKAFYPGGRSSDVWGANVVYDWRSIPSGTGLGYITAPLTSDIAVIGTGSIDLWIKSTSPDTDLEVTITEVRPDGTEMYIQTGWLRASQRAIDTKNATVSTQRTPTPRPTQRHFQPASSRLFGSRCSRSLTRSAPAARSASPSMRRATAAQCGSLIR
jgi:predicted acyl esterase